MSGLRIFILLAIYIHQLGAASQEIPPMHNFSPLDYDSGNQNWGISQSQDKIIFIANNDGLLEFDGATWTLHPSPNETIMRSVRVIGEKVYTGCYMEFGYWQRNDLGVLSYQSISKTLDISLIEDEEFWRITGVDDWVVFQSLRRIYLFNTKSQSVRVIESVEVINKMFQIDEDIYFHRLGKGIYHIENGEARIFTVHPDINQSEVIEMFPYKGDILILTKNNGFFLFEDGSLNAWRGHDADEFKDLGIYSALQLESKEIVLGTISHGLIILDPGLNIIHKINQSNGLVNNTVLSLFEDKDHNVWAGLDNGISYINIEAPIKIFKDTRGIIGSVYASAIFNDYLYLGTNQGLFFKRHNSNGDFSLIEGTQGQVWCLKVIDDQLFCGHHFGTFIIDRGRASRISDIQGTWNVDAVAADLIIQGNYDGLHVIEKQSGTWRLKNKVEGFSNSSRYFEVLDQQIFVNHEYKGVFKLKVDKNFSNVIDSEVDTLLKEANSSISKYRGDILYTSRRGIFLFDEEKNEFVRDSLLSTAYSEDDYLSGRIVIDQEGDKFWLFTRTNLVLVSSGNLSSSPKITKIPISLEVRRAVMEYENIISISDEDEDHFLLGTSYGYMVINIEDLTVTPFNIYLKKISLGINEDHSATENLIDKGANGAFDHDENNLRFSFYTPKYYEYFTPNYQYKLDGLYDLWSEWTTQPYVFFENIPPGHYTFSVRSMVGDKLSENIASYEFTVSKPWYITDVMLSVYVILLVLMSLLIHQTYKRYYRNQREKLIEKNRKELELAMLQNEREIIKVKNERLEKDYKSKSSEAAASAMSIVKKNELLTQIKDQLTHLDNKQAVAPVIKIIDQNLNHDQNWKLFKKAFDNSDSEFFKKVKEAHPDLSPNDLKLCAYLRLNLSSKEIAPLFNISPRSVEIKRYRLRQKMNLDTNENLTEYILSI